VIEIRPRSFANAASLTSITIGSGVTSIGESAFEGTGLASVVIPDSVIEIGSRSFYNVASLIEIAIGSGVTSIGLEAFEGTRLTYVVIPDSVTFIDRTAFQPGTTVTGTGSPAVVCPFPSRCIDPHGCVAGSGGFACTECIHGNTSGLGERAHFAIGDRCIECPEGSDAALLIVLSLVAWGLAMAGVWTLARKQGLPLDLTCSDVATQDLRASQVRYRIITIEEGQYTVGSSPAAADVGGARSGWHMTEAASVPRTESCEDDWTKLSTALAANYQTRCAFVIFDFDWAAADASDGVESNTIVISWQPEAAQETQRRQFKASKDSIVGLRQNLIAKQRWPTTTLYYNAIIAQAQAAPPFTLRAKRKCAREQKPEPDSPALANVSGSKVAQKAAKAAQQIAKESKLRNAAAFVSIGAYHLQTTSITVQTPEFRFAAAIKDLGRIMSNFFGLDFGSVASFECHVDELATVDALFYKVLALNGVFWLIVLTLHWLGQRTGEQIRARNAQVAFYTLVITALTKSHARGVDCTNGQLDAAPTDECGGDYTAFGWIGLVVYCIVVPWRLYEKTRGQQHADDDVHDAYAYIICKYKPEVCARQISSFLLGL
jgi:hypothetical protein